MIIGVPEIKTDLSNVHYLGFFENPRDFYLAADALLHPSVYEPYGQIVAEAIQCQTPVIVSQNVGASEIVSPNEGLVLPPDDLNAWVKAVQFFMPDQFNIPADIAVIKKLTLHHHMQQMLHTARIDT
jgi:glycosyltransferase involved in cell wall biosynthesis